MKYENIKAHFLPCKERRTMPVIAANVSKVIKIQTDELLVMSTNIKPLNKMVIQEIAMSNPPIILIIFPLFFRFIIAIPSAATTSGIIIHRTPAEPYWNRFCDSSPVPPPIPTAIIRRSESQDTMAKISVISWGMKAKMLPKCFFIIIYKLMI